jgi:parallel beta-helix repeat protein
LLKRAVSGTSLILLLTSMVILAFNVQPCEVESQGDSWAAPKEASKHACMYAEGNRRVSDPYYCTNCTGKRITTPTNVNGLDYSVHIPERTETVEENFQNIGDVISDRSAKWIADETSVSGLSWNEKQRLCGDQGTIATIGHEISLDSYPPSFDWRTKDGFDWTTPIRHQGSCGSCYIFCSLAVVEALKNIEEGDPDIDVDLSEQFVLSCCPSCGGCEGGWPSSVLEFVRTTGAPDEACFPYQADDDIPCGAACPDWEARATKITGWDSITLTKENMIAHLLNGPVTTGMKVYEDFYTYAGGIYKHVWGDPVGYHAIAIVGYDDIGGYWICKNSWGTGWGEDGWFRIEYGECEIESRHSEYAFGIIQEMYEHELTVTLEAPVYMEPNDSSLLQATVFNNGLNDESNVELFLMINDTTVKNETVSVLEKGALYTLNYLWTPTIEGIYNVTAYAPPMPDEAVTENNMKSASVFVQVLRDILIVDDNDGSSWISGTSLPDFESALTTTGHDYVVWHESSVGNPPLDFLTNFKLVIWTCGDYWNKAVDSVDAATLESYIIQGGRLLLEGEDIGYDHHADDFMMNVAHAIYQVDSTGAPGLTLTDPTHPVTQGLPSTFPWATDPPFEDGATAANLGMEVIQYTGTSWTAVTVFEGTRSQVVYCAFPVYCLDSPEQETLIVNSVNWLLEPSSAFGWVEDREVYASTESERRPSMATDSNGYLYVTYEHYNPYSGFYEIYVSKSTDNGDTWTRINYAHDDYNLGYPSIAIDVGDNNNIFVAFERERTPTDHDIFVLRHVGGGWDVSSVANTLGSDDRYPSITSEYQHGTNNRQYISYEYVWSHDDRDLMFAKSEDDGATWAVKKLHGGWPDGNVHCQTSITTTCGSDGINYIYIAYKWGADHNTAYDIVVDKSSDRGDTWTQQWVCDESSRDKNWPSIIATHGGGTVVIAWHVYWDSTYLNDVQYAFSTNNGDSWSGGWLALEVGVNEETPTLTIDGQDSTSTYVYGRVHVAYWRDNDIYYRETSFDSPWSWSSVETVTDAAAITSAVYTKPAITIHRSVGGRYLPAAAWTDFRNDNYDIYYSTKTARPCTVHNLNTGLDYCTIQGAIDADETLDGHTIQVDAGTQYEHVVIDKSVTLVGENRYDTLIDGESNGTVIRVTANNVNINGFTIQNSGTDYPNCGILVDEWVTGNNISCNIITHNYFGIHLDNSNSSNIAGNNITNNYEGISLLSSDFNDISENDVTGNNYGISVWASSNNSIFGNNIAANSYQGIYFEGASYNSISGNNITNNNSGIRLDYSDYNLLSWNNITNNNRGILLMGSSNNRLRSNCMANNTRNFGVEQGDYEPSLFEFVHDVDASNTVDVKPIYYWTNQQDLTVPPDAGYVALVNCTRITVQGLSLSKNQQGILLTFTTDSTITGNNATNNVSGISVLGWDSSNNTISGNNVTDNTLGIRLADSRNSTILGNTATNNSIGICLDECSSDIDVVENNMKENDCGINLGLSWRVHITENIITENNCGIEVGWYSDDINITGNNIIRNSRGIFIWESDNIKIYHNNFVNNTDQIDPDSYSVCVWDDGYPSGGNYWSDYSDRYPSVVDEYHGGSQDVPGSDGIWDSAYEIDADNQDTYPLVEPWSPSKLEGDVNGDGVVWLMDLSIVGLAYGCFHWMPCYNRTADLNYNGVVDGQEVAIVTYHWGETDP